MINFFGTETGPHERSCITLGGKTSWIAWRTKIQTDSQGEFQEILCIGNDITSKYNALEELKNSETRYRSIFENAPLAMVYFNNKGEISTCNEIFVELMGADKNEDIEFNTAQKDYPAMRSALQKALNGESSSFEEKYTPPTDNKTKYLRAIFSPVKKYNPPFEVIATLEDISERKAAELEHKRLTTAIDQVAEAIVITDTSGTIIYVNPAFEVTSGYSVTESIGKNPKILKSDEHDEEFYTELWKTISCGKIWKGRFINLSKDGRRHIQEATIGPVRNEEGQIMSYVCVARDITQQLLIEAQLRQAQKLESIGELAAGIAHEINTPTQYVTTNIKFLEDSFAEIIKTISSMNSLRKLIHDNTPIDKLVTAADTIINNDELNYLKEDIPNAIRESEEGLRRITEIVNSVKQLSHPGETQKSFHNLNNIINDAITVCTNEWKYVANIERDLAPDLPEIYCLRGEVGQVVLNLIINSAHAIEEKKSQQTKEKGTITVRSYVNDNFVTMEIVDTGSGMPQNIIERAFDPFFTTKQVGKGTGQGLAIAHNVIVNIHKGFIFIDSTEEVGTTVTVQLPVTDEDT